MPKNRKPLLSHKPTDMIGKCNSKILTDVSDYGQFNSLISIKCISKSPKSHLNNSISQKPYLVDFDNLPKRELKRSLLSKVLNHNTSLVMKNTQNFDFDTIPRAESKNFTNPSPFGAGLQAPAPAEESRFIQRWIRPNSKTFYKNFYIIDNIYPKVFVNDNDYIKKFKQKRNLKNMIKLTIDDNQSVLYNDDSLDMNLTYDAANGNRTLLVKKTEAEKALEEDSPIKTDHLKKKTKVDFQY